MSEALLRAFGASHGGDGLWSAAWRRLRSNRAAVLAAAFTARQVQDRARGRGLQPHRLEHLQGRVEEWGGMTTGAVGVLRQREIPDGQGERAGVGIRDQAHRAEQGGLRLDVSDRVGTACLAGGGRPGRRPSMGPREQSRSPEARRPRHWRRRLRLRRSRAGSPCGSPAAGPSNPRGRTGPRLRRPTTARRGPGRCRRWLRRRGRRRAPGRPAPRADESSDNQPRTVTHRPFMLRDWAWTVTSRVASPRSCEAIA